MGFFVSGIMVDLGVRIMKIKDKITVLVGARATGCLLVEQLLDYGQYKNNSAFKE